MSQILSEVLESNRAYVASFGNKSKLALPPARRFAILTCMDARLDPAKYAGLATRTTTLPSFRNLGLGVHKVLP
jgi:carbonic anhydrase